MRKRVLFLTDVAPLPLERGQRVRIANLLAACGRVGAVTFVGPPPPTEALRGRVAATCEQVVWVDEAGEAPSLRTLLATARLAPGVRRPANVRRLARYVEALASLDLRSFDLVWAERPHMARLCEQVRARTVLDLDDLEHVRIRKELEVRATGGLRHLARLYRMWLYQRIETDWSRGFLASVVCSEADRSYLGAKGCTNVAVVPNSVALPPWQERPERTEDTPLRIVFLGNLIHPPNRDAIEFLVDDVLQRLPQQERTCLDVIGPGVTDELRARYQGRVTFRGFVEDLPAALARYDVLAAPIRFGSGTKVKLLDAMACGIPIVTTPVGAEGLDLVDDEHALIGTDGAALAGALVRLRHEPGLGRRLAAAARDHVERRFSATTVQNQVADWLERLSPTG